MKAIELSRPALGWVSKGQSLNLKCIVLTPVGPGHEVLMQEAQRSVEIAFRTSSGPFAGVTFLPLADLEGKEGRSRRRNDGIEYASANGFEWIFFLDADDLMAPDAFANIAPHVEKFDGVFGMIAEIRNRAEAGTPHYEARLRANQIGPTTSLSDIVKNDPFLTLQMGHFVRTQAAAAVRFDVSMDAGEDFKYYLALWQRSRCAKIDRVLFFNRRGAHSSGPRSANGKQWRETVTKLLREFDAGKG